jgi:CRP-like cAMP-binding protein
VGEQMMQFLTQPCLARSGHFGGSILSPADLPDQPPVAPNALEELGTTTSVGKNAEIWAQGDIVQHSYRIASGCVRLVKLMEDGRRQINEFLVAGDCFGFEGSPIHEVAAEAVGGALLQRYKRRDVEALASRDIGFARWRFDLMSQKLCLAQERMLTLGRRTAAERIAGFLLDIEARTGHDRSGVVALPMCRTDIGDYLGLRLETVCRLLARLQRAGAIRLARTGVVIRNRAAVQACASAALDC